ncbi:hypothetical protein LAZ67_15001042 [Cordylochernes scorpioides]|uniref:Uncharacterized protein n=1 Tax=Cordylochernes scorpioides TaxID=51811 RepID=A0ABY6LD94_9ARAC|nr:hypothetical protein LAZ67_15001042 [Cordylochernes scorpioides]
MGIPLKIFLTLMKLDFSTRQILIRKWASPKGKCFFFFFFDNTRTHVKIKLDNVKLFFFLPIVLDFSNP